MELIEETKLAFTGDQIMTYTGKQVRPLTPDPSTICIEDIAHSLANQCRFTGHTKSFYSVAQHSVIVSEICDYKDAMWGLLHDGSEAYLSDIARPLKSQKGLGDIYKEAEKNLMLAIADKFELYYVPYSMKNGEYILKLPKTVEWADDVLLRSEMRDLMPYGIRGAGNYEGDFLDYEIIPWMPARAEEEFLHRYYALRPS